jgi:hypothetical protein
MNAHVRHIQPARQSGTPHHPLGSVSLTARAQARAPADVTILAASSLQTAG